MIKLEKYEVVGWGHAIRGMRNPMNSWGKGDSGWNKETYDEGNKKVSISVEKYGLIEYEIGPNDQKLMLNLRNAGTDHRKFMRMITVYVDIKAPLYWWKEFDTYKVGTVANSCSTMHKIHAKEFTLDDFSCEHLIDSVIDDKYVKEFDLDVLEKYQVDAQLLATNDECGFLAIETDRGIDYYSPKNVLEMFVISALNANREAYLKTKDKKYWWQMIQLLPSSYNQKRTVMLNYEVLANMYKSRKNHKLDEWRDFCKWIEELPYSELIVGSE